MKPVVVNVVVIASMKKSWLMRSWSQPMKLTDAELELVNGANAAEDSPSPAPPDPKEMPRRGMCS